MRNLKFLEKKLKTYLDEASLRCTLLSDLLTKYGEIQGAKHIDNVKQMIERAKSDEPVTSLDIVSLPGPRSWTGLTPKRKETLHQDRAHIKVSLRLAKDIVAKLDEISDRTGQWDYSERMVDLGDFIQEIIYELR